MCGIAGIFNHDKSFRISRELLTAMRDTMVHRGPDEAGVFCKENVGLAHRRLSIIDLSSGQQPMQSGNGDYCIVFNGEIYNFRELREYCIKKGARFSTGSDTEVILQLYQLDGSGCVAKLRGMFAFAIWDAGKNELFCARDRLGKKPFFYLLQQGVFYFASEIKALLKVPELQVEPDYESLDAFLSLNYIPTSRTAFRGISKLDAASYLTVSASGFSQKKYWDLSAYSPDFEITTSETEAAEKVLEIFDESVKIRLMSEVPLGAFLSGGVDSTSVVARMKAHSEKPVVTTTVGFDSAEFDESEIALKSAKFYATDHKFFSVVPDAEDVIMKVVRGFDEPFADVSAIPTYYVCELARKNVTVALSGDGGDEQFAGYNWYPAYVANRLKHLQLPSLLRPGLSLGASLIPSYYRGKAFLSGVAQNDWDALLTMRAAFTLPEKRKLFHPDFFSVAQNNFIFTKMKDDFFSSTREMNSLRRMQYFDLKYYLIDDILVKVDRMSMLNSLEVRAPLLDHQLIEYAWSLPSDLKLHQNQRKYVFKKAMEPQLPPGLLTHPKKGFTPPVSDWLRGPLKVFATDVLFSQKAKERGFINNREVRRYWELFRSENRFVTDLSTRLWSLLMLELWFREYMEK